MNRIYRAVASLAVVATAGVGLGAAGVVAAGAANALTKSECNVEAAQKQRNFDARQDPTATHATYPQYYCYVSHRDRQGNEVYVVGVRYVNS
ncbi:hypothetical protein [Nocardia sp. NPDC050710]|uniref:hypothetical protein n=1 Tax=Nocardia sp. NPDC050710 TaxID=3157220 RepID=UPI0033F14766